MVVIAGDAIPHPERLVTKQELLKAWLHGLCGYTVPDDLVLVL